MEFSSYFWKNAIRTLYKTNKT